MPWGRDPCNLVNSVPRDFEKLDRDDQEGTGRVRVRMADLPSWCLDWSQSMYSAYLHLETYHSIRRQFSAGISAVAAADVVIFPTGGCLHVPGVVCDVVQEVGPFQGLSDSFSRDVWSHWCSLLVRRSVRWSAICDGCDRGIWGVRHKCFECEDFDFCPLSVVEASCTHPGHKLTTLNPSPRDEPEKSIADDKVIGDTGSLAHDLEETDKLKTTVKKTGDGQYVIRNPKWEELSNIPYRFNNGPILRDAFRKTLMCDQSAFPFYQADVSSRTKSLFDALTFTEFWVFKVEGRPFATCFPRDGFDMDEISAMLGQVGPDHVQHILDMLGTHIDRRRLIVSKKACLGLGPPIAKVGDMICVLHGGRVPFILRDLPSDASKLAITGLDCTLVEDSYVHGLMRGEAIDLQKSGVLEEMQFSIH